MIESVAAVKLPVDETLEIKRNRLVPFKVLTGKEKRISIVTGIHGDELEGQYVCYELIRRIQAQRKCLKGVVDVYPALNPLGVDSITRGIPGFDLDMNRIFPGSENGSMAEYIAHRIIESISGSDVCIDIHASNIYLTEIPQVRINELHQEALVPLAKKLNVDFIWIHGANTVLEATLAHSLNSIGTKTLVVEMGVGMRITKAYGNQLVDGIFNLMREIGIWDGETEAPVKPIISDRNDQIYFINASVSGVFVPIADHWQKIKEGEAVGDIINPLTGEVMHHILSPCDGVIFTLRDYPIVDEGSLIARIFTDEILVQETEEETV